MREQQPSLDPRVLGARLQEARRARNLTQEAVAERLGLARTTLVAIEKGERRITPHEIRQLADLYGRKVGDFVAHRVITEDLVPQFRTTLRDGDRDPLQSVTEQLRRIFTELVPAARRLTCTSSILKQWAAVRSVTPQRLRDALRRIAARARFTPSRKDPNAAWWQQAAV